ncbi:WD repeat-containing protein 25-like isoform X1 [Acipenser oxyrinchus oxyrinchus]|uniref:WD repeat-containing protein 25-like isoform X1 n=1 Tax=Acipenser oxyrinchus oxyrinchus TaxID=40147 RepID=A0AAD8CVF1_ACIOX|nr:WD repeat-containing protein 25-like isoform X1 [Acipenser oxyrinchus oxyrinchus]
MSSLVAYEDSDSEEDRSGQASPARQAAATSGVELQLPSGLPAGGDAGSVRGKPSSASGSSLTLHSAPDLQYRWREGERRGCRETLTLNPPKRFPTDPWTRQASSYPCPESSRETEQGHAVKGENTSLNTQKRPAQQPQIVPGRVKPYVPKRMRLIQLDTRDTEHASDSELQLDSQHDSGLLSQVSQSVKPYLDSKYSCTEIPKRLLFKLLEHQGPVNGIQWCPVPQSSHLLLSASMDRTVKVWDAVDSGRCWKTYSSHSGAVRDACWSSCGRNILSGSFDTTAHLTDVETGQRLAELRNEFRVCCLALQPRDPNVFLCGGFSSEVKAWDCRSCQVIRSYKAGIQQTLDIVFLPEGKEFITSTDSVSRDSADRTLIAWDFQTTAKVSNQIYQERYTCPSLALHPKESVFVAQTNGNYMALFSAQRPYRINKKKRYEGHKVEGYAVGCEFSPDGSLLATGSSNGVVHFYNYLTSRVVRTLPAHQQACVCVTFHPVLPAITATCDWSGEISTWH